MKKNYVLLMAMLFFAVVGFTSCSDDDEGGISGNPEELLVGDWQAQHDEGYWVNNGEREEYSEPYTDECYTFESDGTGHCEYLEDGYTYYFTWEVNGNTLILDSRDEGEERFVIETLNSSTLVLVYHEISDGYEDYYKTTYRRRN